MNICIISPNFYEPTAYMISAYKTALNLAKVKGVKVNVITSRTKGSKEVERIENVNVYRIPSVYIPDPFNYAITPFLGFYLLRLLRKIKPDVYIVNKYMFYTSLSVFYLKIFSKKKVILQTDTFPGVCWFAPSKLLNTLMKIYSATIGKLILKMADKVIILHKGLLRTAQNMGLKDVAIIHNGVDLTRFTRAKPAKDIAKYRGKELLVTFIGRLDEVKGYRTVLKAAKMLHEEKENYKFLFVCSSKYPEKRAQLAKEYPYIKFVGFRKDIEAVLKATDINVLASFAEGLPNSVMEAMAAGCCVIATPVGGVQSLIQPGETGLLFKPGDSKKLSQHIITLGQDENLRKRISKKARNRIEKSFNWKTITLELLELIKVQQKN